MSLKKLFRQFCIICISIYFVCVYAIAAVVSDNDGGIFITKPEMDALRSTFDEKLYGYFVGMDAKIEYEIENYLGGLISTSELRIANAKSVIGYPLEFRNTETNWLTNNWESQQSENVKWWEPKVKFWGVFSYSQNTTTADIMDFDNTAGVTRKNKLNYFYDVVLNSTNDKALLKKKLTNYNTVNTYNLLLFTMTGWTANKATYGYVLRQDLKNVQQANGANVVTWSANNMWKDYELIENSLEWAPVRCDAYYLNDDHRVVWANHYTTGDNHVYVKSSLFWNRGELTDIIYKKWVNGRVASTYGESEKINEVYNRCEDTYLFPVSYDNKVYYTNKFNWKHDLILDGDAITNMKKWRNNVEYYDDNHKPYFTSFIDPGWTLEYEGLSERNWYNCSLIKMDRVYYNVDLPVSGNQLEQKYTSGILLTEFPDKNISKAYIEINPKITGTSNTDRYIIISKKPILSYNPSALNDADELIKTYTNSNCTENENVKYKLTMNKKNVIYINDIKKGDKLYYKIIWNPMDEDNTIVNNEPNVYIIEDR